MALNRPSQSASRLTDVEMPYVGRTTFRARSSRVAHTHMLARGATIFDIRTECCSLPVKRSYGAVPAHVFRNSLPTHSLPPFPFWSGELCTRQFAKSLARLAERAHGLRTVDFCTNRSGWPEAGPGRAAARVRDQLPACEMVLDIIGDLFTHGRQLKHLVFYDRIVSLPGKLPILGCLIPEIVRPVHVV